MPPKRAQSCFVHLEPIRPDHLHGVRVKQGVALDHEKRSGGPLAEWSWTGRQWKLGEHLFWFSQFRIGFTISIYQFSRRPYASVRSRVFSITPSRSISSMIESSSSCLSLLRRAIVDRDALPPQNSKSDKILPRWLVIFINEIPTLKCICTFIMINYRMNYIDLGSRESYSNLLAPVIAHLEFFGKQENVFEWIV